MTLVKALLLGVLQGLTEFLPVSSSGHLVVAEHVLGFKDVPLFFDVTLHLGSLLAVFIFFRKKILSYFAAFKLEGREERREIFYVVVATFVTTAMLFVTRPMLEEMRKTPVYVGIGFLFTAILLFLLDRILKRATSEKITLKAALIVGFFQGIAVLPGVSRSGSTIFGSVFSGIKGEKAFEFSFILAIPAIGGAFLLQLFKLRSIEISLSVLTAGFFASLIASLLALKLLELLMAKKRFSVFSVYLVLLALVVFVLYT